MKQVYENLTRSLGFRLLLTGTEAQFESGPLTDSPSQKSTRAHPSFPHSYHVLLTELRTGSKALKTFVGRDQFAYKEGHNTTMALIKCQHNWLKWLDKDMDFVRIFSFDFSKAFDSVSHQILCNKLKTLNNPFVTNWIISFLTDTKQRVFVDDIHTEMVSINRGVPRAQFWILSIDR